MRVNKRVCIFIGIVLLVFLGASMNESAPFVQMTYTCDDVSHFSPPENLAYNPYRTGFPHPLDSDNGWGGGRDKWDIVDGVREYMANKASGLAFTGGISGWMGPCGWRQATINFGVETTFNKVVVFHHGRKQVPNIYSIQYWDAGQAAWITVFETTNGNGRDYLLYPWDGLPPHCWFESHSTPTENTFPPVTSSKVRLRLNNCDIVHGWIYNFEVYYTEMEVAVDIKPGSCPNPVNSKSKGVLHVAVLGTEDFNVRTIDPANIRLTRDGYEDVGVYPVRWDYEDVATPFSGDFCECHSLGEDGYEDLTLKFDSEELAAVLELADVAKFTLPLKITGKLMVQFGGMDIFGTDCIKVLKAKKK